MTTRFLHITLTVGNALNPRVCRFQGEEAEDPTGPEGEGAYQSLQRLDRRLRGQPRPHLRTCVGVH